MSGKSFNKKDIDQRRKQTKQTRSFWQIDVNTNYWQSWIHNAIFFKKPGSSGSLVFPAEMVEADPGFFRQLINEVPDTQQTRTGHQQILYVVADESIPWDIRDACRYCRVAAEVSIDATWIRARQTGRKPKPKTDNPKTPAPKPKRKKESSQKLSNRGKLSKSIRSALLKRRRRQ